MMGVTQCHCTVFHCLKSSMNPVHSPYKNMIFLKRSRKFSDALSHLFLKNNKQQHSPSSSANSTEAFLSSLWHSGGQSLCGCVGRLEELLTTGMGALL